ncbi:MAG: alpha-1,2-fucosyltransferase [Pyrinomonadaceae bacterium]|nr:alpha-1,2-fucosyltransferase [Sphingobacteriaceae bacterium]
MKIIQYLGGLGNQMFQHAFYLAMRKQFNTKADIRQFGNYKLHNGYELDKVFGIVLDQASNFQTNLYYNPEGKFIFRKLRRVLGLKNSVYREKDEFRYDDRVFDNTSQYYIGYWQNEQYFKSIKTQLLKEFTFKSDLKGKNLEHKNSISNSNSIAIHVRRGDYINHPFLGNICDLGYYQQSIQTISERVENPHFYVFSNDIVWCRENIKADTITYVDENIKQNSFIDMQLMSLCKHQIIANSSFSWWAAWLNPNTGKIVIAPRKWINLESDIDILPQDWIQI